MDEADDLLQRALIDAEASAAVALRVGGLAMSEARHRHLPRPARSRARSRRTSRTAARAPARPSRASELLRVPCDLDLADAADRDEAEELYAAQAKAIRDAIVAADTVLVRVGGGAGARRVGRRGPGVTLDVRAPRAPAHARRPQRARAAPHRRARLRRAHPRRGAAAAGDRVRAAGRRARVPAARRPRSLPRGLHGARPRPRAPDGRPALQAGGVRPAVPGAQRRGHGRGAGWHAAAPRRHRRWAIVAASSSCSSCSSRRSCRAGWARRTPSARPCSTCCRPRRAATRTAMLREHRLPGRRVRRARPRERPGAARAAATSRSSASTPRPRTR